MLYGSVGRVGLRAISGTSFSPLSLFANGEQGGWYDPSDLTTLYQDAAGTTPVTAVEQPVGLVLDKSRGSVGTNGSKRLNLLSWSEDIGNALWLTNGASKGGKSSIVMPDGSTNGQIVNINAGTTLGVYQTQTFVNGVSYTWSAVLCSSSASQIVRFGYYNGSTTTASSDITLTSTPTRYTFTFTATFSGTTNVSIINGSGGAAASVVIWGADLRLSSEASTAPTPYQRITADWASTMSGAHLSQSTAAARPVLSARVNLLTYTEQFDNAAWTKTGTTVTSNAITAPDGTLTADLITFASGTSEIFQLAGPLGAGGSGSLACTGAVYVKGTAGETVHVYDGYTLNSPVVLTGNWQRITTSVTGTNRYLDIGATNGATARNIYLWGADLRPANAGVGLPAYQRVGAATAGSSTAAGNADYDTTGFPLYLKFDGTDDSLASAAIDFTSTDKMSVFAGVRKLSDAATNVVMELSASLTANNGVVSLFAPVSAGNTYSFASKGTIQAVATSAGSFSAPITNVLTCRGDISGDRATLLVNGVQVDQNISDQGTGNYLAYPIYVGSRAGTSLRFNGHLYSLIVRGAATDAATITATETWVNGKTLAY